MLRSNADLHSKDVHAAGHQTRRAVALLSAAVHTCRTTQGLAQRGVDDVHAAVHTAVLVCSAAGLAEEASRVALIDKQVGAGEPDVKREPNEGGDDA